MKIKILVLLISCLSIISINSTVAAEADGAKQKSGSKSRVRVGSNVSTGSARRDMGLRIRIPGLNGTERSTYGFSR